MTRPSQRKPHSGGWQWVHGRSGCCSPSGWRMKCGEGLCPKLASVLLAIAAKHTIYPLCRDHAKSVMAVGKRYDLPLLGSHRQRYLKETWSYHLAC